MIQPRARSFACAQMVRWLADGVWELGTLLYWTYASVQIWPGRVAAENNVNGGSSWKRAGRWTSSSGVRHLLAADSMRRD
jgi:hypothetical protein